MVIGVTGGVGSGKTTFVHLLKSCGWRVIDVDNLAKELVGSSRDIQQAIRKRFGEDCFDEAGQLRRRKLGIHVFSDAQELDALNAIVWPEMIRALNHQINNHRMAQPVAPLVVDMAVLFESDAQQLFDKIVLITANQDIRIQRLEKTRNWTREEIRRRMQSQLSESEKAAGADFVIENSKDLDALKARTEDFIKEIKKESA